MLAVYKTSDNILINTDKPEQKGTWINMINPTQEEIAPCNKGNWN